MKKRVAAAVLGIMLSVSMGLEVPAAALDSGFESGFTSEQAADVQQKQYSRLRIQRHLRIRQQLRSSRHRKARTIKNIQTVKIQEKVQMVFPMALLQVKQWRRMEVLLR